MADYAKTIRWLPGRNVDGWPRSTFRLWSSARGFLEFGPQAQPTRRLDYGSWHTAPVFNDTLVDQDTNRVAVVIVQHSNNVCYGELVVDKQVANGRFTFGLQIQLTNVFGNSERRLHDPKAFSNCALIWFHCDALQIEIGNLFTLWPSTKEAYLIDVTSRLSSVKRSTTLVL
jgi:hypothetical protein